MRTAISAKTMAALFAAALVLPPVATAFAASDDDQLMEKMRRYLGKKGIKPATGPAIKIPVTPQGPHGKTNPHARLGTDKLVKIALQHLAEGRPQEAMRVLNESLVSHPGDHRLRGVRASLYLRDKKYAAALTDLEVALKSKPDDPLLLINRAQVFRGFRRNKEALADLDKAIRVAPVLTGAWFNRGALNFELRNYDQAKADFEKCIELEPHLASARFNLAVTLDAQGKRKQAIAELEQFLKINTKESWKQVAQKQLDNWKKGHNKTEKTVKEPQSDKTSVQ